MSKSLDFCISAALDKERSNISDRDFSQSFELCMDNFCDYFKENKTLRLSSYDGDTSVCITYDPDADFQYFTTSSSVNDGTLLFTTECASECLSRIFRLSTFYLPAGSPKNFKGAELYYTIGNFVVCNEYGERFAPQDKPWMCLRTTVLLPIHYSYKDGV